MTQQVAKRKDEARESKREVLRFLLTEFQAHFLRGNGVQVTVQFPIIPAKMLPGSLPPPLISTPPDNLTAPPTRLAREPIISTIGLAAPPASQNVANTEPQHRRL